MNACQPATRFFGRCPRLHEDERGPQQPSEASTHSDSVPVCNYIIHTHCKYLLFKFDIELDQGFADPPATSQFIGSWAHKFFEVRNKNNKGEKNLKENGTYPLVASTVIAHLHDLEHHTRRELPRVGHDNRE